MKEKKNKRPAEAVAFTVWMVNGGPVPEAVTSRIEEALERVVLEVFNDGFRILTQTNEY